MNLVILIILVGQVFGKQLPPNVCKNLVDYFTMNRNNCWHNPDVYLHPNDIIRSHGYPLEEYEVETEDQYILMVHRMPKVNPKGIILLEPPAFTSYCGWIDKGKSDSLGFMLWDAGYDVWLGNFRGTKFGRKHKFLNPNDKAFWNYSFHEPAKYDMPAHIDLIVNKTNLNDSQGISIISYSFGSTVNIVYCIILPEHCQKWVNLFTLMAPTTLMRNIPFQYRETIKATFDIAKEMDRTTTGELFSDRGLIPSLSQLCTFAPTMIICAIGDLALFGNAVEEEPAEWLPIKFSQNPSGASMKSFLHYYQIVEAVRFQEYDYGKEKNLEYYGSEKPPIYSIENIQVPMFFINADLDPITTNQDVRELYSQLPERAKGFEPIFISNYGHGSYFYGTNSATKVYKPIINTLNRFYAKKNKRQ